MFHHWDFFGPDAEKTAKHFEKHVAEFAALEQLKIDGSGSFQADPNHTCFWIETIDANHAALIKKRLRPRRSLSIDEHEQIVAQVVG
jgi:hypothetical protein